MLPSISHPASQTGAQRLVLGSVVGGSSSVVALHDTVYFGYWFSHWRA